MILKKYIYSESINIYKITFYALNSILIRITGYLLFLGFLFNTLLKTSIILDNINLMYILFFLLYFIIILLILHFYIGFCKNICNDFEFLNLENKKYQLFIKTHLFVFNFIVIIFFFFLISLNYINNLNINLIYFII
jgi:hypothetical protein